MRDHPRACGEQTLDTAGPSPFEGSSPRVRGAARRCEGRHGKGGIIPARAGSSPAFKRLRVRGRDHPRACGEQWGIGRELYTAPGSSPRVRGAVLDCRLVHLTDGIIPARAGSRTSVAATGASTRDHPRACGEQATSLPVRKENSGSSPRVRGAGGQEARRIRRGGIIPARAGSSFAEYARRVGARDHPRACGEQAFDACFTALSPGSSPRVRGAVPRRRGDAAELGIIPARAGSSDKRVQPDC